MAGSSSYEHGAPDSPVRQSTAHSSFFAPLNLIPNLNIYWFVFVAEPSKLLGPHAPALVSKTSDGYACAPDNLTGSVRVPQGPRINHLQPGPQD